MDENKGEAKFDSQGHVIQHADGSKEGAGGWAALATQRSTRHIVDPTHTKTHGPSDAQPIAADPNNGRENPTTLEDQLGQRKAAVKEGEQLTSKENHEDMSKPRSQVAAEEAAELGVKGPDSTDDTTKTKVKSKSAAKKASAKAAEAAEDEEDQSEEDDEEEVEDEPEEDEEDAEDDDEEIDLETATVAELKAYAKKIDVEVPSKATRADLVKLLTADDDE